MQSEPLEVCIFIDENGDYAVGVSTEDATEVYENNIGPMSEANGMRLVRLSVCIPLPTEIQATVSVPAVEETVSVVVK